MYMEIDGQLKSIKRNELTSDSTTILIHTETETRVEEMYKVPSESPEYHQLRKLPSDIYTPSDIVCKNTDFI